MANRPPDPDPYLSVLDVAQQLGFSDQTIVNWIREKKLPAVQIGRRYRIRQSDVDRIVEANRTAGPADSGASIWDDPTVQEFQAPGRRSS